MLSAVAPVAVILAGAEIVAPAFECGQDPLVAGGEIVFAEEDPAVADAPGAAAGIARGEVDGVFFDGGQVFAVVGG